MYITKVLVNKVFYFKVNLFAVLFLALQILNKLLTLDNR